MKKLIALILIAGVASAVLGQSKHPKHLDTLRTETTTYQGRATLSGSSLMPTSWHFLGYANVAHIIMWGTKNGESDMNNWDTMHFSMKKENFRWLNDSTAVYIKPSK